MNSKTTLRQFYPIIIDFLIEAGKFLGFILLAFIALKLIISLVEKALKSINPGKMLNKLNESEAFGKKKIELDLIKIILPIVKWFLILIFVIVGAEILQLDMVSTGISSIIGILPTVISALLIFVIGAYIASLIRSTVRSITKSLGGSVSNIISTVVFYVMIIFVSVAALEKLGVNTTIVTSNITLIFGCILATFTISVGLGSKDIVTRLLLGFYTKKTLAIGDKVEINGFTGMIESIDSIYVVVTSDKETIVYPIKQISETNIKIIL